MKLKFTTKQYQTDAVEAICGSFAGQPRQKGVVYTIDPGRRKEMAQGEFRNELGDGFHNAELKLTPDEILRNIKEVQKRGNIIQSEALEADKPSGCPINLDIEMETGTGKTLVYLKTMFEFYERYGWSKYIIVVPGIAIREGVMKSLEITAEYFYELYGKKARYFSYDSSHLEKIESFSTDAGISVMVINSQAFNAFNDKAKNKTARKIYSELDDFGSRRPIDVLKANHPIMILDEPQKLEGKATAKALGEFNPLMMLRFSATLGKSFNKVFCLDPVDAYNQKLVKKIDVLGITAKGLEGCTRYLYLQSVEPGKPQPTAKIELEVKQKNKISRKLRRVKKGVDLYDLSGELKEYENYVVSEVDVINGQVSFTAQEPLLVGEAQGDSHEDTVRRLQIRETIRAHFQKERQLHAQGIKVLSLFFIDKVSKYKSYDDEGNVLNGEYVEVFKQEYKTALDEQLGLDLEDASYQKYIREIKAEETHSGYFSIDKKGKSVDTTESNATGRENATRAYDLIMKNKEQLLSFEEPVRFIFSHSALQEGWDNPNVFSICPLKHTENDTKRRQEVGRGMRLCVDQTGYRYDEPETAHDINILTVVTNESYKEFATGLQREIIKELSDRPKKANIAFFTGKVFEHNGKMITVDEAKATELQFYLIKNSYIDTDFGIEKKYHDDKQAGCRAVLPDSLLEHQEQYFSLIDSVFCKHSVNMIDNRAGKGKNQINLDNFHKQEFKDLWNKINQKAIYQVEFDSKELIKKCIDSLNKNLLVHGIEYSKRRGGMKDEISRDDLYAGSAMMEESAETRRERMSVHSSVKYDLLGEVSKGTRLKRSTVAEILSGIAISRFKQYQSNPESFILMSVKLIQEQLGATIIEKLSYDPIEEKYETTIFTEAALKDVNLSSARKAKKHIYDYVVTDSNKEVEMSAELDLNTEVVVYSKLPKSFSIPTPVGNYNPDFAVAFDKDKVRHVFFIAEVKGGIESLQLKGIETAKEQCAKKYFAKISDNQVRYDIVDNYENLMKIVS